MRNMYHIPSLEYFTIVKLEDALKKQLEATRRLQQELQQLQDETCLEVDEMQEIIDNQQEHIKQMTAQLHNTLERKLQMSFELSAAQQEIAALKHSHSNACDMNRRLCLGLEAAEAREAIANRAAQQLEKEAAAEKQSCEHFIRLSNQKTEYIERLHKETAAARVQADNAIQDAINCRSANDSLLDINQTLSAKLVAIEQALNPCPTPQQGETVPPRPMWSRYRSE
jgi:hypothetical protein